LDERSDIYSLGVILYEMVAGQAPFEGPTAIAIALKHIKEPPLKKFRSDVPEPLAHLVMESLHVNPSARPQTAAEYARRLRHIEYLMGPSAFDAPEAGADSPDIPINAPAPPPRPKQTFQAAGLAYEGGDGDEMQGRRANAVVASAAEDSASLPEDGAVPPGADAAPDAVTKAAATSSAPADLLPRPAANPESPSQAPVMAAVIDVRSPVYRPYLLVSAGLAVVLALGLGLLWLAGPRTPSDPLTVQATPTPSPTAQGDELVKRLPPTVVESAAKKVPKTPPRGQEQPSPAVIAKRPPAAVTGETVAGEKAAGRLPRAEAKSERAHLRASLDEWVRATNARDIRKQKAFYPRLVPAFYLWRNVSQQAVLAEKARLFGQAKVIDVRIGPPQITLGPDGHTATMRFRKQYVIEGARENRRGQVLAGAALAKNGGRLENHQRARPASDSLTGRMSVVISLWSLGQSQGRITTIRPCAGESDRC